MFRIQKALSVIIPRWGTCALVIKATIMAASSARLMVCLSGFDFTNMRVVLPCFGSTTAAPRAEEPFMSDPSVYTKSVGFHASGASCVRVRKCGAWRGCSRRDCALAAVGVRESGGRRE